MMYICICVQMVLAGWYGLAGWMVRGDGESVAADGVNMEWARLGSNWGYFGVQFGVISAC